MAAMAPAAGSGGGGGGGGGPRQRWQLLEEQAAAAREWRLQQREESEVAEAEQRLQLLAQRVGQAEAHMQATLGLVQALSSAAAGAAAAERRRSDACPRFVAGSVLGALLVQRRE